MCGNRVGANYDRDVAMLDRVEVLRAGRCAVGMAEAVAGRRMAVARASVDVVVAEARADQLLDQESLLVVATRGCNAADGVLAVFRLDALELGCRLIDRFVPRHLAPRVGHRGADHRPQAALLVRGVAPREAPLHAG